MGKTHDGRKNFRNFQEDAEEEAGGRKRGRRGGVKTRTFMEGTT